MSLGEKDIKPILKWAGGKRQLIPQLIKIIPKKYNQYVEPFIGGGALYFYLNNNKAVINDSNPELINLYNEVANNPKKIITNLKKYKNNKEFFYKVRSAEPKTSLEAASRTIYLNRTCFNGLYRVNKKGGFNVPFGNYKVSNFVDNDNFLKASSLLKKTKILCKDYKHVLDKYTKKGDLVFLDPPYLPVSKYSDFKRYTKEQFYLEDHIELSEYFKKLDKKGCYLILTNSNNKKILDLYKGYKINIFNTKRNISSKGQKRTGQDIIVTNFK